MGAIDHIDEARRLLDVTQKRLCQVSGVDPHTYSRIKLRQVSPTERTLHRLRNGLALLQQQKNAEAAE